jgi:hypothetical protein
VARRGGEDEEVNEKSKKHGSVVRGTTFIITGKEAKFGIVKVYRLCPLVLVVKVGLGCELELWALKKGKEMGSRLCVCVCVCVCERERVCVRARALV